MGTTASASSLPLQDAPAGGLHPAAAATQGEVTLLKIAKQAEACPWEKGNLGLPVFTDRWLHTFGTNSGKQVCYPYVAMPQPFGGWLHCSAQVLIRTRCIRRERGVLVYWKWKIKVLRGQYDYVLIFMARRRTSILTACMCVKVYEFVWMCEGGFKCI